jgi:hypothetical protein
MTPEPKYVTAFGKLYVGKSEELFAGSLGADLRGKVQLIFTSPPFPLNEKKQYGNLQGEDYINWFSAFAPLFADLLTPDGSIVIELGSAMSVPDREADENSLFTGVGTWKAGTVLTSTPVSSELCSA